MFDLVQGPEVNDHKVDQLEDKGDHCVSDGQSVVEVEVAVGWIGVVAYYLVAICVVVKHISEVGGLGGSNSDGHSDGKLQYEVEGGQDMSNPWAEFVGTQRHQQDNADEEGQSSSNDHKGSELVVIPVSVVGVSDVDDAWVVIHLEEFMASADD